MISTNYFSEADRKIIQDAIAAAEKRTGAEMVCALSTESGRYDRAESMIGLVGSMLALLAAYQCCCSKGACPISPLVCSWAAVLLGFIAGSLLASFCRVLRRPIVSDAEMESEVHRSAAYVFSMKRLASTREHAGLLIYVSLFERRVVILGDEGVMKATGQPFLNKLRDLAVSRLKEGRCVETFTDTIRAAADELSQKLPALKTDKNELPNQLLVFHPRP